MNAQTRLQRSLVVLLALAFVLATGASTAAELEKLSPETALADVHASKGVVFVDLYADW